MKTGRMPWDSLLAAPLYDASAPFAFWAFLIIGVAAGVAVILGRETDNTAAGVAGWITLVIAVLSITASSRG